MKIKKCDKNDLQAVANFYDEVVLYLTQHINYPKWRYKDYPSLESARSAIAEGSQYMCIDGDKILGAFVINDNPQGSYEKGNWRVNLNRGEYLVIHALATNVNFRGQGVGKYMMDFCINYAKSRGYKAIRLDIVPDNDPARRLYKKIGFTFAGEEDLERGFDDIPAFMLLELNF